MAAAWSAFPLHLFPPNPFSFSSPRLHHPRRLLATPASSAERRPRTSTKRSGRPRKSPPPPPPPPPTPSQGSQADHDSDAESDSYSDLEFDDGIDFPYEDPPLVCCFGGPRKEFVPSVRVHDNPMHPDIYSQWKMLQWDPPEFARAPGGPASNVAVAHVRLGGRAAVLGKVGGDWYGDELVLKLNEERVQTRGIRFEREGDGGEEVSRRTGCSYMRAKEMDGGRMGMEVVRDCPEDSLRDSELNLGVLKEVTIDSHLIVRVSACLLGLNVIGSIF